MINKNKKNSRGYLSLIWAIMFIMLLKTHFDNPFQWKPPSDLLKIVKRFPVEYNRQILVSKYWGTQPVFRTIDFCPRRIFC